MEQNNLSLYRIFYEVCRTLNISRAAKELYISQPAISKSISRLEENLGTVLFLRNSRGVQLTEEGSLLYDHMRIAFEAIEDGEEELRHIRDLGIGQIRIGASSTLCKHVLIPYLKDFIREHPHIKITIQSQDSARTLDMLDQGLVDIGLVAEPRSKRGIDFHEVMHIHDVFVATPEYMSSLSARTPEGADPLESANVMMLERGNMTRSHVDDALFRQKLDPRHIMEISSMDLIIDYARIGMGIGCVIREFVKEDLESGALVEVKLPSAITRRSIGFVHTKNNGTPNAVLEFVQFYKNR
ncbi:MAG: LysR family transcriptional regulator [Lachnospiraceae bacterium]|nr:LysR family transcriptional regulator [Lachnospiraceae bacterium]